MAGAGSGGSSTSSGFRYSRFSCAPALATQQAGVHDKSVCRLRGRGLVHSDCASFEIHSHTLLLF